MAFAECKGNDGRGLCVPSLSGGNYRTAPKSWPPKWLVDLIGGDYFDHVIVAHFRDPFTEPSDDVIAQVGYLAGLERLDFGQALLPTPRCRI